MPENIWNKNSWKQFITKHQPNWPEELEYESVLNKISNLPALVFAGETRRLKEKLALACEGEAFVLQCGDCAEEFSRCTGPQIHSLIKVILQMSTILAYAGEKNVVNIGRMAGQFVKPRTYDHEHLNGIQLPSYFGDMINSADANIQSRTPDAKRVLEGYFMSAATLNLVRAFTKGGYGSLKNMVSWHSDFNKNFKENSKYIELSKNILKSIKFLEALGLNTTQDAFIEFPFFTSHEALLLGYESALTRIDTTTGDWYDTSAHMLWIGNRTKASNEGHVEFLSGVKNPIGVKIGPEFDLEDLKRLIIKLNPKNEKGRLTFIIRMGAGNIEHLLPNLLKEIKKEGFNILWISDPMHGNTYKTSEGKKTRHFDTVMQEIELFFKVCQANNVYPGGVHLELTGDHVTECLGGIGAINEKDLSTNYTTVCDPRLNFEQSVELAFRLAEIINKP
jgi:3-deoxy-7-phosphoheptulonate synthase